MRPILFWSTPALRSVRLHPRRRLQMTQTCPSSLKQVFFIPATSDRPKNPPDNRYGWYGPTWGLYSFILPKMLMVHMN